MEQVILGGDGDALNNAADEYNVLQGGATWNAATTYRYQCVSPPGTLSRLFIELSGVPGVNPYRIGVYINGALTALAVTVAAGATTGSNTVNSINVNPGDIVCIQSSRPIGNPTNTPRARWSVVFTGTNSRESLLLTNGQANTAATNYVCPEGNGSANIEFLKFCGMIGTSGHLKDFYVNLSGPPGGGGSYTLTLRRNGVDTPLTVTINDPNTTGSDVNVGDWVAVAAGDYVSIKIVPAAAGSTVSARLGITFQADIDGESLIMSNYYWSPAAGAISYNNLCGNYGKTWDANEYFQGAQNPLRGMKLRKFYMLQDNPPNGGGTSFTYRIRGGGGNTPLVVTITDPATAGNDIINTYDCVDFDDLSIMCTPGGVPFGGISICSGLVAYTRAGDRISGGSNASKLITARII